MVTLEAAEPTADEADSFRSETLLLDLWRLARRAGRAISEIYDSENLQVAEKSDSSPVTAADLASEKILVDGLRALSPELPVLSEERESAAWAERRGWRRCWIVDPLDGTRELIARNGEFTVNIALADRGEPVLGVVHAPVLDRSWLGVYGPEERDSGRAGRAWRVDGENERRIRANSVASARPTVVASRSHRTPGLRQLHDRLPPHDLVALGSSLKFCWVAEGKADFYARLSPTMEWDSAAGHAVLRAAGGEVIGPRGRPLRYNRADLRNPGFVAHGLADPPWSESWRFLDAGGLSSAAAGAPNEARLSGP